jgi:LacI family transcriptional regulator
MWDHLDLELTVEDVAREIKISKRQLERRFRKALDRGVNEELNRKRLEEFRHLLLTTDLTITKLAPLIGFHSTTYLHRMFRSAYGMTPAQYRRERQ